MRTSEANFHFPVLGFSGDADVWGFPDLRSLTTCGRRTLKDDMQIGMELVDAAGRRWVVRSVQRTGRAGSPLSWWLSSLLSGPQFRIEHELDPLEAVTLQEAQDRICAAIQAHPEFWCEDDELDTELASRLAEVRAAKALADIPQLLGLDTFEAY